MSRRSGKHSSKLLALGMVTAVLALPQCTSPTSDGSATNNVPDVRGPDDPRVCAEALCIGARDADVDGDGTLDKVQARRGLLTDNEPGMFEIAVTFGSGAQAIARLSNEALAFDVALMGASDVNGDGQSDIFAIYDTGAHARSVQVLEYRDGKLTPVRGLPENELYIDSSDSSVAGFRCGKDGNSATTFVVSTVSIDNSDPETKRFKGQAQTYRADKNGTMNAAESAPIQYELKGDVWPQALKDLAGGNCAELDVFPEAS